MWDGAEQPRCLLLNSFLLLAFFGAIIGCDTVYLAPIRRKTRNPALSDGVSTRGADQMVRESQAKTAFVSVRTFVTNRE